jgi:adenylate cyclase
VSDDQEIERSYLLLRLPDLPARAVALKLEQGYLPDAGGEGGVQEGRLRRTVYPDGRIVCKHTIKHGEGLVRTEIERTIDEAEFEAGWPRTAGRRLRKTRYAISEGERTWEVDDFLDIDLVLAEVELPTPDTEAPIPAWLAPHLVREVTDEPEYRNFRLALRIGSSQEPGQGAAERDGPP